MPVDVFKALLENAKLEQYSDTHFGLRSKYAGYEIYFGTEEDTMYVDCFGFNHGKGWVELDPTDAQYSEMKRKLDNVEREIEHEPLPYVDEYWENGHELKDFY